MVQPVTETIEMPRKRFSDRVPVEQITADARQADPGRAFLALFGAIFIAIGWTVGKICTVIFASVAWSMSAMKYGWRSARGTLNRPTWEQLYDTVQRYEAAAERQGVTLS